MSRFCLFAVIGVAGTLASAPIVPAYAGVTDSVGKEAEIAKVQLEVPPGALGKSVERVGGDRGDSPSPCGTPATAIGDFNGDGLWDIAVANRAGRALWIFYGLGVDGLSEPATYVVNQPEHITARDVTGDGYPDLVVVSRTARTLSILVNDGRGAFSSDCTLGLEVDPIGAVVGDLTEGGIAPIAVVGVGGEFVIVEDLVPFAGMPTPGYSAEPVPTDDWSGAVYYSDCGSEPWCATETSGIQECLDTVWCRAARCHWAACMQYVGGDKGWVSTTAAHIACAAVADTEAVLCLPTGVVDDWS